ncbi:NlpC/P60 family protein [Streptomyces rectiverticillatus]|uniref:peptidase M23 n=1 Tax=Streptomyces rectiverticillatus TaxID=173860 RepID=UPI0015C3D413|nr:peptidase M23 [Streptomyces rectiverticillatus]QLE72840.1 NlpC/P60 family protein [Streptomyces rectiverticillatus]
MVSRQALALASGGLRKGLAFKLGIPAMGILMGLLLIVGMLAGVGGGPSAVAAGCSKPGSPGNDGPSGNGQTGDNTGGASKKLREEQVANAKIIDQVAKDGKLPGRATLIALMTGLAESQLSNINYGDRDSLGIFQQRPSSGWGTKEQVTDPKYAAHMFLFGGDSGDPPGLVDVAWESMSLNDAAQKVQRSGFPDAYGPKEAQARSIAKEAGIDLERSGENHPGQQGRNNRSNGGSNGGDKGGKDSGKKASEKCNTSGSNNPGKPGEPFHDGKANWPANVKNPRSTDDAIAWAKREADSRRSEWYQRCLAFTSIAYGWSFSGTNYAIDHYQIEMPKDMRHDGDRNPPPGALMFWDTGHRAGHVAVYVGDGKVASNDIVTPGEISVVPATDIETKWNAKYLGWSPPYYPKGG